MINLATIQEEISSFCRINSHEELLFEFLNLYKTHFPVKNAFLMRYSPLGDLAQGIIAFNNEKFQFISQYIADVKTVPIIFTALKGCQSIYIEGPEYLKIMPSNYIEKTISERFIVVPIFHKGISMGYICGDEFEDEFNASNEVLKKFTIFGSLVGDFLMSTINTSTNKCPLSKRELEVMRLVAIGENSKAIAHQLYLSDVTVNEYIKSAIRKLSAKNRVEAAIKLCKSGWI